MKLEDQYSWKELSVLIADRIEKTRFITAKTWNRQRFIDWFMQREKIGLVFDWRMVARCYTVWKLLQDEADSFTVITSREGMGKSSLGIQMCAFISPNMNMDDIVFDMPDYINKLKGITKDYKQNKIDKNDKSIQIDEGGLSLFSRESMSASNKILAKSFFVQRFLNVHVCICIPFYWSIDGLIRNHRINTLIIIKERGKYKAVTGRGIKILNKLGEKDKSKNLWSIPIPYGMFWEGHFRKDFPNTIAKEEYEQHKFKHIQKFLDTTSDDIDSTKMMKLSKVAKDLSIGNQTLIRMIKDKRIKGKKIGTNWFITRKEYDRLSMA